MSVQATTDQVRHGSLRKRLLTWVGGLVLLSLLGSALSVFRIRDVARSLDRINSVSIPLGRILVQLGSDADSYRREVERRVITHPLAAKSGGEVPAWVEEVILGEISKIEILIRRDLDLAGEGNTARWERWVSDVRTGFADVRGRVKGIRDSKAVSPVDTQSLAGSLDAWVRQVEWGASEHDRLVRARFSRADAKVTQLRAGLEIILGVVVALSLLLLWLGERALRPLSQLSTWVRRIADRGVRREDKVDLPLSALNKNDEVGRLARDFHQMATVLIEREKEVELQQARMQDQNRLLSEMSELNWNVLASIKSALMVIDADGRVKQMNPAAGAWLGVEPEKAIGQEFSFFAVDGFFPELKDSKPAKLTPAKKGERTYGGRCVPLRSHDEGLNEQGAGWILLIDDLTEETELQERLRQAENLAAVGRMSAQVAHEIRNPLHSIGLEAELALDSLPRELDPSIKVSLSSILRSVGRLQDITDRYLKLSRLSSGEREPVELSEVIESVLATYATACQETGISVDWRRMGKASPRVACDRSMLEQSLGNLMSNAIDALNENGVQKKDNTGKIRWTYGLAESGRAWIRIEDNGRGIADAVASHLFQPFVTAKARGTGLGLSFVKKVIEEHGGMVEGMREGHDPQYPGACFEIRLPATDREVARENEVTA